MIQRSLRTISTNSRSGRHALLPETLQSSGPAQMYYVIQERIGLNPVSDDHEGDVRLGTDLWCSEFAA